MITSAGLRILSFVLDGRDTRSPKPFSYHITILFQVILVRGHYVSYLPLCSRNEPVFLCMCTPLAMPETRECVVHGATNVFTTVHAMDMKILHIDSK